MGKFDRKLMRGERTEVFWERLERKQKKKQRDLKRKNDRSTKNNRNSDE